MVQGKGRDPLEVHHAAVRDVELAVGPLRVLGAVGDHDDGRPRLVDLFEEIHDLARHGRVQVARGLVGQDHLGIAGQHAGDGHALLLAARELRRQVAQTRREPHLGRGALDALLALLRRQAPVAQRHVHVVEHVEIGNQIEALEDEPDLLIADARHLAVRKPADVLVVEVILPLLEAVEETRDVEERGLARARRTGDGDELPFFHFQREIAQRPGLHQSRAIDLGNVFHLQHGFSLPRAQRRTSTVFAPLNC